MIGFLMSVNLYACENLYFLSRTRKAPSFFDQPEGEGMSYQQATEPISRRNLGWLLIRAAILALANATRWAVAISNIDRLRVRVGAIRSEQ
jgi:hypothetical protein